MARLRAGMRPAKTLALWLLVSLLAGGLSAAANAADLRLAGELSEEGDWAACLVECRRVDAARPGLPGIRGLRAHAEEARAPVPKSFWRRAGEWPIRGLVGFYRFAIGPAIGNRCILEPSCSRYALEAARRSGWLSIPMTGDRLIREPSVVQAGEKPVFGKDGQIRYADPVTNHAGGG